MKIKVLESSLQKLVLQVKPIGIAYWLAGITFIGSGILVAAIFGRSMSLTCTKNDAGVGKCQFQQHLIFGSSSKEWALSDLKGAKLDDSSTDEFFGNPLVLETQTGQFRLTLIMADAEKKRSLAAQIDRFLESNATNKLNIEENIQAISYSLGALLCVAGIFNIVLILLNGRIVLTLNRAGNRISVVNHRLFGDRIWSAPLSDLLRLESHGVGVAEMSDPTSYKVNLVMRSGEHISLGLLPLFSKAKASELSNYVYDFLNKDSHPQN
ncbi:hypothetical protein [Pseudanabaena sp. PCC 6802]|uniref:hypothetical protein n=1 Tax=Pseudanabaena sp. PCC 6802 TaxID=118173 RepID=UPI00034BEC37|nr:hypothetical protein [Pseudanabaena sp. PCC 6802]